MDDLIRREEEAWLGRVLVEAKRLFDENIQNDEKLREDALETQKDMWEELGPISAGDGMTKLITFMEYIDAMKRQKRGHVFHEKLRDKYARMLLSPYFGRIDFRREGSDGSNKHYIGLSNLLDENYKVLVCDWRAPVSGMFYDFETGPASYECPNGTISGELTLKRQYKIAAGKIEYMFDSSLKIDDEMLQQILSRNTENRMKAIVTSIQREQNRAIRNERYQHLIVAGPAGSGKTSVALHRAAYLLYKHRDKVASRNILIFSPNEIFNDYISNVLPELGEENLMQTTFAAYMQKALDVGMRKESYAGMMEYLLEGRDRSTYPARVANIRFKSSAVFMEVLEKYAEGLNREERRFPDLVLNGKPVASAAELDELYNGEYRALPLKRKLERMRARMLFLLKAREDERVREIISELRDTGAYSDKARLRRDGLAAVKRESSALRARIEGLTAFDLLSHYRRIFDARELFKNAGAAGKLDEMRAYTLENLDAGQLFYEDQAPLLYLEGAFGGAPKTAETKFVIIDEAQDYTPLQYRILRQHFRHANITLLGDPDQAINPHMNAGGFEELFGIFPGENTLLMRLTKSYRSTLEISAFAKTLLPGEECAEPVERHGDAPEVIGLPDRRAIHRRLVSDIEAYLERGYRSIGILARTRREAEGVYRSLKGKTKVRAILDPEDGFDGGAVVMPSYLAKGLEFDAVIVYDAGGGNYACEEERKLLYTVLTRALHALRVYYAGELTPLLNKAAPERERG